MNFILTRGLCDFSRFCQFCWGTFRFFFWLWAYL